MKTPPITVPDGAPVKPLSKWDFIWDAIRRNWRTTGCGVISAAASFIVMNPQLAFPPPLTAAAGFIATGGLVLLGICAKDSSLSGNPNRPSK